MSRLMKQEIFHRVRGLLSRTCFALRINPRDILSRYTSCVLSLNLIIEFFKNNGYNQKLINK